MVRIFMTKTALSPEISCWIVTETDLTGTENQCLGVAAALGGSPSVRHIGLRQPWKTLSPWLGFEQGWSFTGDSLEPAPGADWPRLLIAAGRKSAAASRYVKKKSGGRTFTVQIQDPRVSPRFFDLLALPAHDLRPGKAHAPNVVVTAATPNRITPETLAAAREKFAASLQDLPQPRVAVLIGGDSRTHRLTPAIMRELAGQLKRLASQGAGLMVTTSRRTGAEALAILQNELRGTNAVLWTGHDGGENPYHGFLAWADYIVVTADSASMISDAATTGKPVLVAALEGGSARFDRLHRGLQDKGVTRAFSGTLENYSYAPLRDAELIAAEIRKRLG